MNYTSIFIYRLIKVLYHWLVVFNKSYFYFGGDKLNEELRLNDIADELLILSKYTVDRLYSLDNCADCIALYVFYYKTAKWQKTNRIKATDEYVKKSLKWGIDKIRRTKDTLKQSGLIDIVQYRENGKIKGWYIQVNYIISERKIEDVKIIVDGKNTQNLQVEKPTSRNEDTNALRNNNNKCLNNNNSKVLKEEKHIYGEFKNVFLTDEEYRKIEEKGLTYLIEELSSYIASTGKKYKSHYATILNWSRRQKKTKEAPKKASFDVDKYNKFVDNFDLKYERKE